jgi:hypothetical protein
VEQREEYRQLDQEWQAAAKWVDPVLALQLLRLLDELLPVSCVVPAQLGELWGDRLHAVGGADLRQERFDHQGAQCGGVLLARG